MDKLDNLEKTQKKKKIENSDMISFESTEIDDEFEYLETGNGGILRCKLCFENGIPALFKA